MRLLGGLRNESDQARRLARILMSRMGLPRLRAQWLSGVCVRRQRTAIDRTTRCLAPEDVRWDACLSLCVKGTGLQCEFPAELLLQCFRMNRSFSRFAPEPEA